MQQRGNSRQVFTKCYKLAMEKPSPREKPPEEAHENLLVTLVEALSTSEYLQMV